MRAATPADFESLSDSPPTTAASAVPQPARINTRKNSSKNSNLNSSPNRRSTNSMETALTLATLADLRLLRRLVDAAHAGRWGTRRASMLRFGASEAVELAAISSPEPRISAPYRPLASQQPWLGCGVTEGEGHMHGGCMADIWGL